MDLSVIRGDETLNPFHCRIYKSVTVYAICLFESIVKLAAGVSGNPEDRIKKKKLNLKDPGFPPSRFVI
jgi:hypothetical protein